MESASFIALSNQMALRRRMDVIATNVANMETPAYKADRMLFQEVLMETTEGEEMAYVEDTRVARDLTEGSFTKTGNDLDLAIHGDAFFVVDTPAGERYTRNGRLTLDVDGQIVTTKGHPVMSESLGPILVPETAGSLEISRDGTISDQEGVIGRLRLVRFEDRQALTKEGESLYSTAQVPQAAPDASIVQGMVEESNVESVNEMVRMMHALRAYQSAQKIIDSETELQTDTMDTLTQTA